jgi:hypothetical protein
MIVFADTPPPPYFVVNDLNGAIDEPGQEDLTRMGRYDDPAGFLDIFWSWDEGTTAVTHSMRAHSSTAMATERRTMRYAEQWTPLQASSTSPKAFSCDTPTIPLA